MVGFHRGFWFNSALVAAGLLLAGWVGVLWAQWGGLVPGSQFELSDAVQLDQADNAVLAQLERVKTLLADRQWDEAIEILRQLPETSEGKLMAVAPRRYIGLGQWCQLQLAALPSEALRLYRGRVDSVAKQWYERGIAERNRQSLQKVVDQAFASSYGDLALMALGDMAFESGDYSAARWNWERIVPSGGRGARGEGQGDGVQGSGFRVQGSGQAKPKSEIRNPKSLTTDPWPLTPSVWPAYPDSKFDLAAVRARLVLVSILEGATARARAELAEFARLHPDAEGRLGGREGKYVELLQALLAESATWPEERGSGSRVQGSGGRGQRSGVRGQGGDSASHQSEIANHRSLPPDLWPLTPRSPAWPTFAGNPRRNQIGPPLIDVGGVAWRIPLVFSLGLGEGTNSLPANSPHPSPLPRGEGTILAESLSFHPLAVGNLVLVNNDRRILAVRRDTGRPAWGKTAAIYQAELAGVAAPPTILPDALGSPQFTMTVFQGRLFARMGTALTGQPQDAAAAIRPGYLVCLDLAAQGRLLWKIEPDEGWAFDGSPLADERGVYVAMRRQDIRPQAAVACFEADTGRLRWRRFICGAETPSRGVLPTYTHNLLTLAGGVLYYNTNLGAVAAVRADDGRVLWVSFVSARIARRPEQARAALAARTEPLRFGPRHAVGGPGRQSPDFRLRRPDRPAAMADGHRVGRCRPFARHGGRLADCRRRKTVLDQPAGRRPRPGEARVARRPRSARLWPRRAGRPKRPLAHARQTVYLRSADRGAAESRRSGRPRGVGRQPVGTGGGRLLIATESELIALGPYGGRTHGSEKSTIAKCKMQIANLPSAICNLHFASPNLQFPFGTTGCIRCLNTTTFKPYKN